MSVLAQVIQAQQRPWFKEFLEQNGISENDRVEFRLAYFEKQKKVYVNSCHRIKLELKAIKRIRPVLIDGKKIFKVFLHNENRGANSSTRFPKDISLHGNNVLGFHGGFSQNISEALKETKSLHDKKEYRVNQSSILNHVSEFETHGKKHSHSVRVSGKMKNPPKAMLLPAHFFTFEDIKQKLVERGEHT